VERMRDRTAVVVGVSSPVGLACAQLLAQEGAEVAVVDRDELRAHEVGEQIDAAGGSATPFCADPTSEQDAARLADACEAQWQRVDALIHCTAAMDYWLPGEDSIADWEVIARLNIFSPVFYTKALLPLLKRSKVGSIVYFSALDGICGNPAFPAWSATKGALIPLTHVSAYNLASDAIRVNCIASALAHQTGSGDPQPEGLAAMASARILESTPLGRRPDPLEIASVALFLASSDSSYMTGTVLRVDGGRMTITPGTGHLH
jgi:NAD(P)-dependent dehydrogenase (short-subunit alcohol dehydrogenase family)